MIPYSLSSVVAMHHDYPTNNVQGKSTDKTMNTVKQRHEDRWLGAVRSVTRAVVRAITMM
jgi:hypothetical protein